MGITFANFRLSGKIPEEICLLCPWRYTWNIDISLWIALYKLHIYIPFVYSFIHIPVCRSENLVLIDNGLHFEANCLFQNLHFFFFFLVCYQWKEKVFRTCNKTIALSYWINHLLNLGNIFKLQLNWIKSGLDVSERFNFTTSSDFQSFPVVLIYSSQSNLRIYALFPTSSWSSVLSLSCWSPSENFSRRSLLLHTLEVLACVCHLHGVANCLIWYYFTSRLYCYYFSEVPLLRGIFMKSFASCLISLLNVSMLLMVVLYIRYLFLLVIFVFYKTLIILKN